MDGDGILYVPLPREIARREVGRRVETGVIQFGEEDWPGIFIRGDRALHYSYLLRGALFEVSDPIRRAALLSLAELLGSCRESIGADPGLEVGATLHSKRGK